MAKCIPLHAASKGPTTDDIRRKLRGIDMNALPAVAEARDARRRIRRNRDRLPSFAIAAKEVAMPIARLRARSVRLPLGLQAVVLARPNLLRVTSPVLRAQRSAIVRSDRMLPGLATNYRGLRAMIVAECAAKIALACRDEKREGDLDAIVTALRADRQAALDELSQRQAAEFSNGRTKPHLRKLGKSPRKRF